MPINTYLHIHIDMEINNTDIINLLDMPMNENTEKVLSYLGFSHYIKLRTEWKKLRART
jgi:hypothetical protein